VTETRLCPVEGCGVPLRAGMLLCLRHWRRVPRQLQGEVWSTWKAVLASLRKPVAERADEHVAYGFARQAAIDAVNAKVKAEARA
jgi:hypothetical protein